MMSDDNDQLQAIRHSLAHLLAYSVKQLYPGSQNAIGPAIENGFYQDFEMSQAISEDDLPKIEAKMKEVLQAWQGFERREVDLEEALRIFADNKYKQELAREFAEGGKTLTVYISGEFVDLCKGGHVDDIKIINPEAFTITKTAGAYWRGDEKNLMLTRIYGAAFEQPEELQKHLKLLEEARQRDHRKLGQELDLFVISDLVGSGLPLFTPRGTVVRDALLGFSEGLQRRYGYEKVAIPHITKQALYETSGHWDKFGDELFLVKSQETSDQFVLKPMNCPHHTQIYAARPRSYRDLPLRYMESTIQYRDEKKGELNGLSRVRSITIDDSHVFCRMDQIEAEFEAILNMVKEMYSVLGMQSRARLSFRDDSEGYLGDPKVWQVAEKTLEDMAKKVGLEYFIEKGEAAFYGPKIDIMVTDALGREWQCATEQLDFVQPERFGLTYTDEAGKEQRPVMIHKALLGSVERFLSVYIEHTAGRFPVWVAPEQVRLITVNQEKVTTDFAAKVAAEANEKGLRLSVDNSNESVGKKIRAAELAKIPYVIVIGEKEVASGEVVPRIRKDMAVAAEPQAIGYEQFLGTVANEVKSRVLKTSL